MLCLILSEISGAFFRSSTLGNRYSSLLLLQNYNEIETKTKLWQNRWKNFSYSGQAILMRLISLILDRHTYYGPNACQTMSPVRPQHVIKKKTRRDEVTNHEVTFAECGLLLATWVDKILHDNSIEMWRKNWLQCNSCSYVCKFSRQSISADVNFFVIICTDLRKLHNIS